MVVVVVVTQKIDGGVKIAALGLPLPLPLPVEGQIQFKVLHAQLHNAESGERRTSILVGYANARQRREDARMNYSLIPPW